MAVARDYRWISDRYSELQRKYPRQYVAIKDGKVVAHGRELKKVYERAKYKVKRSFVTEYILSGEPFILKTILQGFSA